MPTCPDSNILLTTNEGVLIHNVLNEVLHGLRIPEFDRVIGTSPAQARALLDRLSLPLENDHISILPGETSVARAALRESMRELGVDEFSTRTCFTLEEADALLSRLSVG